MNQHLKVFIEVVECESFTKAAEKLHMTQPAVSQSIAKLEEMVKTRLIERTNKRFFLNGAGKIVYQYGKNLVRNFEQMQTSVEQLKLIPSGQITIGASYTIGEYVLPNILIELHKQYPNILPNVIINNSNDIYEKLLNNEIDIGFIEGDIAHANIEIKRVTVDEMYIFKSNRPYLKENDNDKHLADETWIIREEGSGTRKYTEYFLNKQRIKPKTMFTFGSTQIIKETVESGLGISLISKWAIQKELQLQTVKKLPVAGTPVTRDFSLIKLKQDFTSKAVDTFEKIVMNYFSSKMAN